MAKNLNLDGTFKDGKNTIQLKIPVWLFEDDGTWVAYCPLLDLSGYANDELAAMESFKVVLGEFLSYTVHKKTLEKVLNDLGWTKLKKSKIIAPSIYDILSKNENAREIAENYPFTQSFEDIRIPEFA
ncbi:MAG: hypothetical protein JNL57_04185 [Bacteroidetes bacterium]|nr:hypothetical protein [Bacteroidota bacterium]